MHLLLGKRQLVLAGLVVLLGLAVFINWYYTGTDKPLSPEGTSPFAEEADKKDSAAEFVNAEPQSQDAFAAARLARNTQRDKSTEELKAVMASAGENTETAAKASAAIEEIQRASSEETNLESLIGAATGKDCVAVISENTVNIIVPPDSLNDEAVLKISDIVSGVCSKQYENVRISAAGN